MAENFVRARYTEFLAFERALRTLKDAGVPDYEAFGPTNIEDLADLMPRREEPGGLLGRTKTLLGFGRTPADSPVRFWATLGGITGLLSFWLMCVLSSLLYVMITGGKPPVSNVPFVIPAYEGTILLGSLGAFAAAFYYARMWFGRRVSAHYDPHFSGDSFGIVIRCEPRECRDMIQLLANSGAVEINEAEF
ncbi:MAG TPA: quinol:electron acceptor oxidoreductase subunit ActD [Chloroflexota bacterium]|nr:quinol:electron acceptor oxidoreductase subunit ActD [Chloroflexota bacterium]